MRTNQNNVCETITQWLSQFKTPVDDIDIITIIVAAVVIYTAKCSYQSRSENLFYGCSCYSRGLEDYN